MNKEIRDLFDRENIITKKITIKKNVRIIESNSLKFVIKRRDKDLNSLFKYLTSRSFNNFPKIIYQTDNYDIYEYLEDTELPIEQRSLDIIKLTTMLHSKTTFYKEVDEDYYKKVYEDTRKCLDVCDRYGKDHNIWIQGYAIPAGTEEDMVYAADAAYDAGARTILYWGYRGSEGNDYRAKQPDLAWRTMGDAMARLMERERERRRLEMRKMLGL